MKLDYTIQSFVAIDVFFDKHSDAGVPVEYGRLSTNTGLILFSLGSYVGQTIIKNIKNSVWQIDENNPGSGVNASVKLSRGSVIFPIERIIKRFQNGAEESIQAYGYLITKDYIN